MVISRMPMVRNGIPIMTPACTTTTAPDMKGLAVAAAGTTDLTFATYVGVNTYIAVSGHYKV